MKRVFFSTMALAIAIGGMIVSRANAHRVTTKVVWLLKPGNNHSAALIPTAYTLSISGSTCDGSTTICGIYAEAQSGVTPARPNLTTDATLHDDLVWIKSGANRQRNNSGEVYFMD